MEIKNPKKTFFIPNIIVSKLCYLWPFRNKHLWVFGALAGRKYDDNSKYMFEYVNSVSASRIRAVWLTRDQKVVDLLRSKGYECHLNNSWHGKWLELRAGAVFYSHSLMDFGHIPLVFGSEVVALWHGLGFKKIYNSKYEGRKLKIRRLIDRFFTWAYRTTTVCTSEYSREWMKRTFTLNPNEIYITGQSRNDVFATVNRNSVLSKLSIDPDKTVVIYMPTYRQTSMGEDAMANIVSELYHNEDFMQTLRNNNIVFMCKLHPQTPKITLEDTENFKIMGFSEIESSQELMSACDMLVTDFSSCFVDYALLNRPILFYLPDEKEFLEKSEKMENGFFEISSKCKATTPSELAELLSHPSLDSVCITNEMFDDDSIKGTCYSENIYKLILKKLKIS